MSSMMKITLIGPQTYALGRFRFEHGKTVKTNDPKVIAFCQNNPLFACEKVGSDEPAAAKKGKKSKKGKAGKKAKAEAAEEAEVEEEEAEEEEESSEEESEVDEDEGLKAAPKGGGKLTRKAGG